MQPSRGTPSYLVWPHGIALSTTTGTAIVTPNFAAGMQTNCTNPNTYQPCFSTRSVLPMAVGGGFRYRTLAVEEKTIRTPVKTPLTNSTPLEMLAPKSHILSKDGLEAHVEGGDVEDRIRRFSQFPVTHANREDTSTNVRSMRSAINYGPS